MLARISTRQTANGRHVVNLDLDGAPRRIRRPGFPSAAAARSAGVMVDRALGRTVVSSFAAAAILAAGGSIACTGDARAADIVLVDRLPIVAISAAHRDAIAAEFGCIRMPPVGYVCDGPAYRVALARHSA